MLLSEVALLLEYTEDQSISTKVKERMCADLKGDQRFSESFQQWFITSK